jgi:hypothetical protein
MKRVFFGLLLANLTLLLALQSTRMAGTEPERIAGQLYPERLTVIDVQAPDRLGVLHAITRALSDQGLAIHLSKVATEAGRVVDIKILDHVIIGVNVGFHT